MFKDGQINTLCFAKVEWLHDDMLKQRKEV